MIHKPTLRAALVLAALVASACSAPAAAPAPASPGAAPSGPTPASGAARSDPSLTGSTTIFVVRHAERASATDRDSPLSEIGHARARALADALADAGIDAIYTSQFVRTRETAAPVADRLGLPMIVDSVTDAQASSAALGRRILAEQPGGTVLVVGHSNTVSLIVRALGGMDVGELGDADYDNLFMVVVGPQGEVGTVRSRFGAPD